MRILQTYKETYADGPGIRYAIYVSGCDLECKGCHNQQSWEFNQGKILSLALLNKIESEIILNPMITGVTISGGDPLHPDNAHGTQMILEMLQHLKKHIIVFTGRTFEQLVDKTATVDQVECLRLIDVLVDGPFVESLRDTTTFRGSTNQRFIKTKEMYQNVGLSADNVEEYTILNM